MPRRALAAALAAIAAAAFAARPPDPDDVRRGIRVTLDEQAAAWNRGDIDGFMEGYWKSDDLTFSASGKTTRGWNATRDRYKTKYATRDKMGRLAFSELEIRPICDDAALVLGRWRLQLVDGGRPGGNFSLVLTRQSGRWVIIHDHTSSDEPATTQPAATAP